MICDPMCRRYMLGHASLITSYYAVVTRVVVAAALRLGAVSSTIMTCQPESRLLLDCTRIPILVAFRTLIVSSDSCLFNRRVSHHILHQAQVDAIYVCRRNATSGEDFTDFPISTFRDDPYIARVSTAQLIGVFYTGSLSCRYCGARGGCA